ncbi:uncharacterized protein I303_100793 [Kwoniella dejecticola CBS 10117]|uniref:Peptidase A1 domain-containing protein n=1 Tax=Kwoniella dejecticola CBS 10117 TaxID=1296121 RepID=A0A1A6AFY2_9TREE|nr:uncharacterized protein I303_00795 [Kwoniella dejecticola CBS 10117]OBR88975.1 hypothetical protein I303_00795 [Kwoniella dejecticola CBS 10117]
MFLRVLQLILSLTCLVHAQITFPVLSDPSFSLLSGEVIVSQQLKSWGIRIGPIKLNLGLDLSALGLNLRKREERRSRAHTTSALEVEDDLEKRLIGLDLGLLNLGLNFAGSKAASLLNNGNTPPPKALINLALDTDLPNLFSWGDADDVARGERGDTEWFTYISIGTPPQSLPVLPDTGSSDLFVFGPNCPSCNLANHTAFHPSLSSTYRNISEDWRFLYADGSGALGYTSNDVVTFGNGQQVSTSMDFAIANEVGGNDFKVSQRSGVLGLGLDGMATIRQGSTLFSRLVKSNSLTENLLSIRLQKGLQYQGTVYREGRGQYTFGGIEETSVLGGRNGLTWSDVQSQNYWGISMDDISVGANSVLAQDGTTPRRAIIDTGTTLIITSNKASLAIHAQITRSWQDPRTSIWYIPCTTSYPATSNVFVTISGRKFGVSAADLAWKKSSQYSGLCISGVQGGMETFTVLGDMFIKNHYVVLSYGSSANGNRIQVGLGDRPDVGVIL